MRFLSFLPFYIIAWIFVCIPLMHSYIFNMFGISFPIQVDGNYEFTKVMIFQILMWIAIAVFFLKAKKEIIIPMSILILLTLLIVSNMFSFSFFTSFFWNNTKAHSSILFINLLWLFVILIHTKKSVVQKLVPIIIGTSMIVALIGIKEYYFPSFDYANLSNRALSTLGHPNYLALYIWMILPLVFSKERCLSSMQRYTLWGLLIFTLILTKSLWWIGIFFLYSIYKIQNYLPIAWKKVFLWTGLVVSLLWIGYIVYDFSYITKLHSFLSRFFIWETTLSIIFSDIKIFFVWWGLWTLDFVFDSFKSEYLYLFENFWFTANRPHNIFLWVWYHLGIWWVITLLFLLKSFFKNYQATPYHESILLFLIFSIFHFASITHYIILVFMCSIIYIWNHKRTPKKKWNIYWKLCIIWLSILGLFRSLIYYEEERKSYQNTNYESENIIIEKLKISDPEKRILWNTHQTRIEKCENLISYSPSAENYFYCGNILWRTKTHTAKKYYEEWLRKVPDIWRKESPYHKNFLIKYFVDGKRFFSWKYSNIEEILKRVWE